MSCEDNHITVGIPVKVCVHCGKAWLTGDPCTPENEIKSWVVVNDGEFFGDCHAENVVYVIPRED